MALFNWRSKEEPEDRKQRWQALIPNLNHEYELARDWTPYSIAIDFGHFSPGEMSEVVLSVGLTPTHIEGINKPDATLEDEGLLAIPVFTPIESYEVKVHQEGAKRALVINEDVKALSTILFLDVPRGPWRGRISYKQTVGQPRAIRYLVYR